MILEEIRLSDVFVDNRTVGAAYLEDLSLRDSRFCQTLAVWRTEGASENRINQCLTKN